MITPIVQQKAADAPAVVVLFAVVIGSMLFGPAGALAATPAAVLVIAVLQQDFLPDRG